VLLWGTQVMGKNLYLDTEELKGEAENGFREIISLWREGRFDELYERTTKHGSRSREYFVGKLGGAEKKPACCWEMIQDLKVKVRGDGEMEVKAQIGLEKALGGTEYHTRSFKLIKEDGVWKIPMADLVSLSGKEKKKSSRKKKPASATYGN